MSNDDLQPENLQGQSTGIQTGDLKYDVNELLKGRLEVKLMHQGQEYRLRITKNGKLILTK